jgi:hypothetical protein
VLAEFQKRLEFLPGDPLSANKLARDLIELLEATEYMAAEYDPDRLHEGGELSRFRDTEAAARERRDILARASGWPTGDTALGDLDGYLSYVASRYREKAVQLRRELGARFTTGSHDVRTAMVRDWLRNFREQGRLPKSKPPSQSLH